MNTKDTPNQGYFVVTFGAIGLFTPFLSFFAFFLSETPYYEYRALRYSIRIAVSVLTPGMLALDQSIDLYYRHIR
jgi:hypothetical protein